MNALPAQDDAEPSKHPSAAGQCRAHKFGGSSLADAGRMRHVASLLLDAGEPRQVVVVSACAPTAPSAVVTASTLSIGSSWQTSGVRPGRPRAA